MRTLLGRLLAEKPSERPASAEAALKLLDRRVPVGVLSVGGSAALALVAFLVMGPGLTKKASMDEAALKDVEAPVQQQKEPPVAQPEESSPRVQSKTLPAKLISPTSFPPKGTPKKQREKASGTDSGKKM